MRRRSAVKRHWMKDEKEPVWLRGFILGFIRDSEGDPMAIFEHDDGSVELALLQSVRFTDWEREVDGCHART